MSRDLRCDQCGKTRREMGGDGWLHIESIFMALYVRREGWDLCGTTCLLAHATEQAEREQRLATKP